MMRLGIATGLMILSAATAATPAYAETLRVRGIAPADTPAIIGVHSVTVEPFAGQDGPLMALMIGDRLGERMFDGEPWLHVLPASGENADAALSGYAQAEVSFAAESASREECVEEDTKGHCTKKIWIERDCRRRTVTLTADMRLTAYDGRQLYRQNLSDSRGHVICKGDRDVVGEESVVRDLAGGLSERFVAPLFAFRVDNDHRVLERRKGLTKPDEALFKQALKYTKTDAVAACHIWGEMVLRYPQNPVLLFNLGLCKESAGDWDAAEVFYTDALSANPKEGYAKDGLKRLNRWRRGVDQVAVHFVPVEDMPDPDMPPVTE